MPYSRKPIIVNTNNTFNEWRVEINAAITKLNELFDTDNEFHPAPGSLLDAVTVSGSTITDSTVDNSTINDSILTAVTVNNSTWNDGSIDNATVQNSTFDDTNTFNNPQFTNANLVTPTISGGTIQNAGSTGMTLEEPSLNDAHLYGTTTISGTIDLAGDSSVVTYSEGTAFPASGVPGNILFRTDLGTPHIYTSSGWIEI